MKLLHRQQIESILATIDPLAAIETGFVQYSQGKVIVPPVGELLLDKGEMHVKYGYVKGDDFYVIKLASGFYQNHELDLPSSNGVMLLFSQKTGQLVCILLDEGHLTDIRTAIAGAISAKYLAPKRVSAIGIIGTGIQAKLQPQYLKTITDCRHILVWGRNAKKLTIYQQKMQQQGFTVTISDSITELTDKANLIVTTTPSTEPLLKAAYIKPGTHITAVGSDTAYKQELASEILLIADLVVADSISQCLKRGEIYQAITNRQLEITQVLELGNIINDGIGRTHEEQITVADLTGVAIQDIKIAEAIYLAAENNCSMKFKGLNKNYS